MVANAVEAAAEDQRKNSLEFVRRENPVVCSHQGGRHLDPVRERCRTVEKKYYLKVFGAVSTVTQMALELRI